MGIPSAAMGLDPKHHWFDPAIDSYVAAHTAQPDELQRELIAETAERTAGRAGMQVSADEGALLALFVGITGARNVVEVGTFTGYSSLCIARALPPGGRLLCCDVSEEWTAIARRYWTDAAVADRITLRVAPAIQTLRDLPIDDPIDLAFIDADKTGYASYYDELLRRMRPSGVILVDNTLWSGRVLPGVEADDADTLALREFNEMVATDGRVESYILPVADGLTVIRKR
jgi:caffeoyl-CoA O-methyltransferase